MALGLRVGGGYRVWWEVWLRRGGVVVSKLFRKMSYGSSMLATSLGRVRVARAVL